MKKKSLGLCLITKNEEENITRVLSSVLDHVDHVYLTDTGSTDLTVAVAEKLCKLHKTPITVTYFDWIDDFSAARNFNFKQATTDWVLWLDADDTLEGAEKLPEVLDTIGPKITGLFLNYKYESTEKGEEAVGHMKLRMVKNGMYHWSAPIHENLMTDEPRVERYADNIEVVHHTTDEHFRGSLKRNLRILEKLRETEEKDGKLDPRTTFLLSREYMTAHRVDEMFIFGAEFLAGPGTSHEKLQVCGMFCQEYEKKGDFHKQLDYSMQGLKLCPDKPLPYLLIAAAYSNLGEHKRVIEWVEQSLKKTETKLDGSFAQPADIELRQVMLLADAFEKTEQYKKAEGVLRNYFDKASDSVKKIIGEQSAGIKYKQIEKDYADSYRHLFKVTAQYSEKILKNLIKIIPRQFLHSKFAIEARQAVGLARQLPKNNITIFCGSGQKPWHEDTLKKQGLGGSETAVIEAARRLGAAGYQVDIYNSVKKTKKFKNVTYIPAEEFDPADRFRYFIPWRSTKLLSRFKIHAYKKFVWLHDVPNPLEFTGDIVDQIDKIFVLTKFHRQFLPAVDEEKFFYTSNGIDLETIKRIGKEGIKREPHTVIYASSPDRGLDNLLDCWEDVLKEVPDAKLILRYGWDTFDELRQEPHQKKWKADMQAKMKALGVDDTVRVTKEELYRDYYRSAIWAYPTEFEEINCIVAQEAQACGVYPVTTGFAALEEMQLVGRTTGKYTRESFTGSLLEAFKMTSVTNYNQPDSNELLFNKFSWDVTMHGWLELFDKEDTEPFEPLVTVAMLTIRPGPFRVLKETLEKQTYKNFEVVVVDGRYDERHEEVAEYMKDFKHPFLHLPDPNRSKKKYPYGLCHADNAMLEAANGELMVFVQDFIEIPENGIEKYVELYRNNPYALTTGVDDRRRAIITNKIVQIKDQREEARMAAMARPIDIFGGWDYTLAKPDYVSPRIWFDGAVRISTNPAEWELNYAAAPTEVLKKLGGWIQDWDRGFGFDNTQLALRYMFIGGQIIVDETNKCTAINHWDLFPKDAEGVPHREKQTNDKTYTNYFNHLRNVSEANVVNKKWRPKYPSNILDKIKVWKGKQ